MSSLLKIKAIENSINVTRTLLNPEEVVTTQVSSLRAFIKIKISSTNKVSKEIISKTFVEEIMIIKALALIIRNNLIKVIPNTKEVKQMLTHGQQTVKSLWSKHKELLRVWLQVALNLK